MGHIRQDAEQALQGQVTALQHQLAVKVGLVLGCHSQTVLTYAASATSVQDAALAEKDAASLAEAKRHTRALKVRCSLPRLTFTLPGAHGHFPSC